MFDSVYNSRKEILLTKNILCVYLFSIYIFCFKKLREKIIDATKYLT
jgi:hypothetical protein